MDTSEPCKCSTLRRLKLHSNLFLQLQVFWKYSLKSSVAAQQDHLYVYSCTQDLLIKYLFYPTNSEFHKYYQRPNSVNPDYNIVLNGTKQSAIQKGSVCIYLRIPVKLQTGCAVTPESQYRQLHHVVTIREIQSDPYPCHLFHTACS